MPLYTKKFWAGLQLLGQNILTAQIFYQCSGRGFAMTGTCKISYMTRMVAQCRPRASAIAERLWSASDVTDADEAAYRLDQQRCRFIKCVYSTCTFPFS